MKPAVESARGVIASGHPLASAAGALMLEKGGNIVDAIVATSFALGVVEPDASGIGGDGQAILFLKGMREPVVIEYKDMTPIRATADNPKLFRDGQRIAGDGPTVANIPGVVAGLTLLHQKYGSKKVTWAEILAPAIALAEEGYILDEALPTTIAVGRDGFARHPEAAKIYLPGGKIPKPGDRFVNKDYAETLKVLAKEGGEAFYRGSIARRIAEDMAGQRRHHHRGGPRAVPGDGTRAAGGPVSRPHGLLGAAAGFDRPADGRDAADPRRLHAEARRHLRDGR